MAWIDWSADITMSFKLTSRCLFTRNITCAVHIHKTEVIYFSLIYDAHNKSSARYSCMWPSLSLYTVVLCAHTQHYPYMVADYDVCLIQESGELILHPKREISHYNIRKDVSAAIVLFHVSCYHSVIYHTSLPHNINLYTIRHVGAHITRWNRSIE